MEKSLRDGISLLQLLATFKYRAPRVTTEILIFSVASDTGKIMTPLMRLALLAGLAFSLGTTRNGTGIMDIINGNAGNKAKGVENQTNSLNGMAIDTLPIVPEQTLGKDHAYAKSYRRPDTRRNFQVAATSRRIVAPQMAATKSRIVAPVQGTRRRVGAWGGQQTRQQSSSLIPPIKTRRQVLPAPHTSTEKISKGYVRPAAAPAGGRRDAGYGGNNQTIRQMKGAKSTRGAVAKPKKDLYVAPPLPPPPPPGSSRKQQATTKSAPPMRPAVLQQQQSKEPRRMFGASTRRVVAPVAVKSPLTRGVETTRRATAGKGRLRIAEDDYETSSSIQEIIPVRTRRKAEVTARTMKMPAKKLITVDHKRTKKQRKFSSELPSSFSTESEDTEETSSESEVVQTRKQRQRKVPVKKAAPTRKPVKEVATKRKQTIKQTKRKVVESSSDDDSTTSTFERQFTRRKIKTPIKTVSKKVKGKGTRRKVVVSSSSETEESSEISEIESESTSSSSEYVQTRRKTKPVQTRTKLKIQPVRGKSKQETRRRIVKEPSVSEESSESYRAAKKTTKQQSTKRDIRVATGGTKRKIETATKRKVASVETKRKLTGKKKAIQSKYAQSSTEPSSDDVASETQESTSYRPERTRKQVKKPARKAAPAPKKTRRR